MTTSEPKAPRYPHITREIHEDANETWVTSRHPVDGHEFGLRYPNDGWRSEDIASRDREVDEAIHTYVAEHPEGSDGDNA